MEQLDTLRAALANRYDVDREIGRGGMARVYLARDRQHDRQVALKVLAPDLAALIGPQRFLREIRIAARLHHPHILPLHDSGAADGLLYYVMPYVRGESLRQRLKRETQLPLEDALRITREVVDALTYAHAQGVIHRDIKPANILLSGYPPSDAAQAWHALVADFGIARAAGGAGEDSLTLSGMAIGTPEYMSPEQGSGDPGVDARTDIYSLGCVLYEMLAGAPPFSGRTVQGLIARHRLDAVPPVHVVRPSVPAHVERAIERALAKVPADRFQTAHAFAAALEQEPTSIPTGALRSARVGPERAPVRRWLAGAAAVVAAAAGLTLAGRGHLRPGELGAPSWILVADFDGPAGDRTLATAVRELVTAELEQSRTVAPMPRQQLGAAMREAGIGDSAPVTGAVARELAVRSAVRTVLGGSVLPMTPGRYSIVLRVADADSGRAIVTVTAAAADSDLIPVVQRAARDVRQALGERRAEIAANKPLVQAATPSFAAYRLLVEAKALSRRGELAASNRLLQEAIALDTGFASAWASMGTNFLTMRNLDSAGAAYSEALRRPARLTDAQRYELEAETAYSLRYDIPAAVRWYDLLVQVAPRSYVAHNNRAIYLYSLGRYDEALAGFVRAEALAPIGTEGAQVAGFNQAVTLLALGRDADAGVAARRLAGHYAAYAAELIAVFQGRWAEAELVAQTLSVDPRTPSWIRSSSVTLLAGAEAARGAVRAADTRLRQAAAAADQASRPWFGNAVILLSTASGRSPGPPPAWLLTDTTVGGLVAAGLWAVAAGDSVAAARRLAALDRRPATELRRLGFGPALLRASVAAAEQRWGDVIAALRPAADSGERDGGDLDQVSSVAVRWLVAEAYVRTRRPDSAAAMYAFVLDPRRTPFGHLALRGLVFPFAHLRLARLYEGERRPDLAAPHWQALRAVLVTPDSNLDALVRASR
jgi:serine/threonine-protein kinase